jgi:hypothetical protein
MQLRWMIYSIFLMLLALPMASSAQTQSTDTNATPTKCRGCLCPGNPCQLCRLPPHSDDPIPENEPVTCRAIREAIPPAPFQPGENEYFANLDKSTMMCIRSGGDVIPNNRRAPGYPARVYCKPDLSLR